jgi:hypothetical protein
MSSNHHFSIHSHLLSKKLKLLFFSCRVKQFVGFIHTDAFAFFFVPPNLESPGLAHEECLTLLSWICYNHFT